MKKKYKNLPKSTIESELAFKGIEYKINQEINSSFVKKLDDYLIEGLKMKGFFFSNKEDMFLFVKNNCHVTDNKIIKQRIYFVNKQPFFLHNYEIIIETIRSRSNEIKMTSNFGTYSYL